MSRSHYFSLVCTVVAASLVAFRADAIPFLPYNSSLSAPNVTLVAETCAAGYTLHPRLHLCVGKPTCGPGSAWHPRLHRCVGT